MSGDVWPECVCCHTISQHAEIADDTRLVCVVPGCSCVQFRETQPYDAAEDRYDMMDWLGR